MAMNGATIDAAHPALITSAATREGRFLVFHFALVLGLDSDVGLGSASDSWAMAEEDADFIVEERKFVGASLPTSRCWRKMTEEE